ncbi:MAG TPA: YetF domain-containing protein [Burkholderiales bacterium]|nr:YetF domain-containing protein [Burkholderiales bacterium]
MIRGSAVYWFLFLVFRIALRRDVGAIGVADVLLVVLIADAAQNAMAGEYRPITEGAVLVSTIIGWNVVIDGLAYRFEALRRMLEPGPLPLVRDGRILRGNLRRELMSVEDLLAKLREQGVDDVAQAAPRASRATAR